MTMLALIPACVSADEKPNIVFVFSDDHACHAISSYGSIINKTPNIDRIAQEGAIFRNNFCGNSICAPSRATILTGKHSHLNGQLTNRDKFDGSQLTFPKLLQKAGYTTGIFGKWHLKSDPTGFDEWMVYPGQGDYYSPEYLTPEGRKRIDGYSVEVTTDLVLDFIKKQKNGKPFMVMCQYKAPHRNWMPGPKYLNMYDDVTIPEPETLFDDYRGRATPASEHKLGIDEHMTLYYDLKVDGQAGRYQDVMDKKLERLLPEQRQAWDKAYGPKNKKFVKSNLSGKELVRWKHQRYVKDYLRCVAAVDDNLGRILDYLKESGLDNNTIVIYSSDQGFYLGEHGWYDKRWMYEESFRMPLVIRWPGKIKPGTKIEKLTQNIDFAPSLLDAAGLKVPEDMQGKSLLPLFNEDETKWRDSLYYHYYEHRAHGVAEHYGVRTASHKLIHFPRSNEWELFDLDSDPQEIKSIYGDPQHKELQKTLKAELYRLRDTYNVPNTN
ncbi:sulfatase [bacterium E08(2017)]|nr:sulfatase [bacterium E08(2017)]